ncbi:CMGC kinase [Fusarium agapanthi]|uniref:CMGC kinase n=1 Tax=Fusarium agapanthi TaxID=1803897 RepID=A0A9P5BH85_9HYPO|nr:CMGC kinase [Fusarium agapanthi]
MNRVPTIDSLLSGSTQPAPLIEEPMCEEEDAQDWGDYVDSDEEPDVEFACQDINPTLEVSATQSQSEHAYFYENVLCNSVTQGPEDTTRGWHNLNTANIMHTLRRLNNSIPEKYKQIGRPRKIKLWTEQWKDGELVMPMKPKEELIGDSIVLGDFGLAHKAGASTQKMQSPATYCTPERVHNINPSFGSDMWSYMCIFFELYTGTYLFQGWGHASVVSSIVCALGPLPVSWLYIWALGL